MKLAKAREILELRAVLRDECPIADLQKASKLGAEALELILRVRAKGWSLLTDSLPSETTE